MLTALFVSFSCVFVLYSYFALLLFCNVSFWVAVSAEFQPCRACYIWSSTAYLYLFSQQINDDDDDDIDSVRPSQRIEETFRQSWRAKYPCHLTLGPTLPILCNACTWYLYAYTSGTVVQGQSGGGIASASSLAWGLQGAMVSVAAPRTCYSLPSDIRYRRHIPLNNI